MNDVLETIKQAQVETESLSLTDKINAVLPQTQCGLCDYDGCKPYAEAIATQGEKINKCPPGGIRGLIKLGELTNHEPTKYMEGMRAKQKPILLASIREDECIGCMKCIQACPVDAIVGAAKMMHTVISDECSGCELCVAPCPVDCIDMVKQAEFDELSGQERDRRAQQFKQRFDARERRLSNQNQLSKQQYQKHKLNDLSAKQSLSLDEKKAAIQAALKRVRNKSL